jgi:hypothetical protein
MSDEVKTKLVVFFFELRANLYLYHLTTYSHPRHLAAGTLVTAFDLLIDRFLEAYFGKYGRPDAFSETKLNLSKLSDSAALFELDDYINFLNNEVPTFVKPTDTDLINIRDEMVGLLNNNKYLFLLK